MTNQYKEELMAEWKEFSTKYLGFSIDEAKDQEEIMSWWLQKIDEAVEKRDEELKAKITEIEDKYWNKHDTCPHYECCASADHWQEILALLSTPTHKVN